MDISILGCGWLGTPLANHLLNRNHHIKGSTTSEKKIDRLQQDGIEPYLLKLSPGLENAENLTPFWNSDVLVINIPPGRSSDNVEKNHKRQIESIIEALTVSSIEHVIFVSSTSVYPSMPGTVFEDDAIDGKAGRDSGNALLKAEELLLKNGKFKTTILRFGGLFGGDRHPAKYMAGRNNLSKANAPVNLIHRDDCIAIITQIIEEGITGEIFNAVSDAHPTRKDYYTAIANKMGLEPPTFIDEQEDYNYKIVSSRKLKDRLGYSFIHSELKVSSQP